MTLDQAHFTEFFTKAHPGKTPYRWQQRLLAYVCAHGHWPKQVVAPTGAGKTAVIDVHLFAVALMALGGTPVPRRLALVVDRRALTDDQYDYADALNTTLRTASADSVAGQVAAALRTLRSPGLNGGVVDPVLLGRIRGGVPPAREWLDEPEACAVLCATPAMWGSRLLFRGYGSTRLARPREAGLLAMDAVTVIDEAHLSQQTLTTARRVAALAAPEAARLGVPVSQVVETTATAPTPADDEDTIGVIDDDLVPGQDDVLRARITGDKALKLEPLPSWPVPASTGRGKNLRIMADLAARKHAEFGSTVGVYVNTVDLALDLATELTRRSTLAVGVFCGRTRPFEVTDQLRQLPTPGHEKDKLYDVVVTTQTLEVGIDCSFSAGISELASASALAQRAGRIGRTGARTALTVVVPSTSLPDKTRSGPYTAVDLAAARQWLDTLPDMAPWTVAQHPPHAATPRRRLYQRLEQADADFLSQTCTSLDHDHDVDLWLAEDFDTDHDIGLLVRTGLPAEPDDLLDLLDATPVQDHEVFPTRLNTTIRHALSELIPNDGQETPCIARIRGGEVTVLSSVRDLTAGDLVVVDATAALFRFGVVAPGPETTTEADVLEAHAEPKAGQVVLRVGDSSHIPRHQAQSFLDKAAELDVPNQPDTRGVLADLLTELADTLTAPPASLPAAIALLADGREQDCEVTLHHDLDDEACRLIVRDLRRATRDEDTRQTFTTASTPVPLDQHNTAVGHRADDLARRLHLPGALADGLATAGRYHDVAKGDDRFQRFLGNTEPSAPWAKSAHRSAAQRRADRRASGLPSNWRHEQLSALIYLRDHDGSDVDFGLVARLVGTSHGYGRRQFPHTAAALLPATAPDLDLAEQWFDDGAWDALIDTTHHQWGLWGCAYLEALLRAADSQISREGS